MIVAAPALALAGGTVLALRLLPAGGKAGDRLAARGRRLTAAMASWQISRQPIRQGGAALLIVLAVATGTLALSQRASWTRSVHDQAAFGTGADVRVQASQPLSAAQAGAGSLPADGADHTLTASRGSSGGAIYPLRLISISLQYTLPARKAAGPAVFTLDSVSGAAGTAPVPGTALRSWPAVATSDEL